MGRLAIALLLAACLGATSARADFDAGLAAYDRGDFAAAFAEWEPLAKDGDPAAERNLGQLYRRGLGVPQDFATAAKWYRRAAYKGLPGAQVNLAMAYFRGQGVSENAKEAARWFQAAAHQGHAIAQYNLGLMYARGMGVAKDDGRALGWLNLAAKSGHPGAVDALSRLVMREPIPHGPPAPPEEIEIEKPAPPTIEAAAQAPEGPTPAKSETDPTPATTAQATDGAADTPPDDEKDGTWSWLRTVLIGKTETPATGADTRPAEPVEATTAPVKTAKADAAPDPAVAARQDGTGTAKNQEDTRPSFMFRTLGSLFGASTEASEKAPAAPVTATLATATVTAEPPSAAEIKAPPSAEDKLAAAIIAYHMGNYTAAEALLTPLAAAGHDEAQYRLGLVFADTANSRRDPAKAVSWLDRAAKGGHTEAAEAQKAFKSRLSKVERKSLKPDLRYIFPDS